MIMDDDVAFATAVVDLAKHRRRRADAGLRLSIAMIPVCVAATITMSVAAAVIHPAWAVGAGIALFWAFAAFAQAREHAADHALWSAHKTVVAALEHALLDPPAEPGNTTWLVELPDEAGDYGLLNDLGRCGCGNCTRAFLGKRYTVLTAVEW